MPTLMLVTKKVMFHLILIIIDLRDAMVPLLTPFASHDTDVNTNGFTWPKRSCCTPFQLFYPKEYDGAIDDGVGIM